MATHAMLLTVAAVGLWLTGSAPSQASTITANPASLQNGITYEFGVTMNGNDNAVYQGAVGAKSFSEPGNPDDENQTQEGLGNCHILRQTFAKEYQGVLLSISF